MNLSGVRPRPFRSNQQQYGPRAAQRPHQHFSRHPLPRTTFDILKAEEIIKRSNKDVDMTMLSSAMAERVSEITPGLDDAVFSALSGLMLALQKAIDRLAVESSIDSSAISVRRFYKVGSFKTDTILAGHNTADVVLMVQPSPTYSKLTKLSEQILGLLTPIDDHSHFKGISSTVNNNGFVLSTELSNVNVMVCGFFDSTFKSGGFKQVSRKYSSIAINAVNHTKWMEDTGDHSMRVLVRLLKDIRRRIFGLQSLSSRMIEILASFSISNESNKAKHLNVSLPNALLRALQLISSGLFLPGSAGVPDPTISDARVNLNDLSFAEMDSVCRSAQAILRLLHLNAYREVLFETSNSPGLDDVTGQAVSSVSSAGNPPGGGRPLFDKYPQVRWADRAYRDSGDAICRHGVKRTVGCAENFAIGEQLGALAPAISVNVKDASLASCANNAGNASKRNKASHDSTATGS